MPATQAATASHAGTLLRSERITRGAGLASAVGMVGPRGRPTAGHGAGKLGVGNFLQALAAGDAGLQDGGVVERIPYRLWRRRNAVFPGELHAHGLILAVFERRLHVVAAVTLCRQLKAELLRQGES